MQSLTWSRLVSGCFVIASLAASAVAQCGPEWLQGAGMPGLDGSVNSMVVWDQDGPGPLAAQLVVGGRFSVAGDIVADNLAAVDLTTGTWAPLGAAGYYRVDKLLPLPGGDLLAAGVLSSVPAIPTVRRWNGTSWSNFVLPPNIYDFRLLEVSPSGDVFASILVYNQNNYFVQVVRWDGVSWTNIGGQFYSAGSNGVLVLAVLPNGDMVAGGYFTSVAGLAAKNVARWNGTSWSPMGAGLSLSLHPGQVDRLAILPNGEIAASGQFSLSGAVPISGIARWTGTEWVRMNPERASDLVSWPPGRLLAATGSSLQVWDGTMWSQIVSMPAGSVSRAVVLPNGDVAVAGGFTTIGGATATNLARWDGVEWHAFAKDDRPDGGVSCFARLPNGDYVVGGALTKVGGLTVNRLARWDGSNWSAFGSGADAPVYALAVLTDGSLVAGGAFTSIDGVAATNIARWDGTTWSALGAGTNSTVRALALLANGDLMVGGTFTMAGGLVANRIARWDGNAWSTCGTGIEASVTVPSPLFFIGVTTIAVLSGDRVAVGGVFSNAGAVAARNLALWDGASWSSLATSMDTYYIQPFVSALAALPNGHLVAAGRFETIQGVPANAVAEWTGGQWTAMGSGLRWPVHPEVRATVQSLAVLPNGDVVAGGQFTVPANYIARWDGTTWTNVDGGTDLYVNGLHFAEDGTLLVGGDFIRAGGQPSNRVARYRTTCPATATTFATGCTGPDMLTVSSPAWVGSAFRTTYTGAPSNTFVLALTSFGTIQPGLMLDSVWPMAGSGCTAFVPPDIVQTLFTTTGTATTNHFLVNTPPLVGVSFYHQMIPVEVDATGAIVSITASDALQLTAGLF